VAFYLTEILNFWPQKVTAAKKSKILKQGTSDLFELFFDDKSAIIPVKTIAKMAH